MVGLAAAVAVLLVTAAVALVLTANSSQAGGRAVAWARTRSPYQGLGAWADMYSWSGTFTGGSPRFGPADIDAMAAAGVQTLYIQAASQTGPATVLEPDRLLALIGRAHKSGISVVVWYFPSLVNLADDMTRLIEISRLPSEGVAVDIEATDIADIGQRNASVVALSQQLRRALPGRPLGAIVLPATLLEVVNPRYWPNFPYVALAPFYDAWLPMVYWTGRLSSSGFRDGYRYTADSVGRLRAALGPTSTMPVHPIAGVSVDGIGVGDMSGFVKAARDTGSIGGSVYEWVGTDPALWRVLRGLRVIRH